MNLNILGQIKGLFVSIIPFSSYFILLKLKFSDSKSDDIKFATFTALFLKTLTLYALTSSITRIMDTSFKIQWHNYAEKGVETFGTVDAIVYNLLLISTILIVSIIIALLCNKLINKRLKSEKAINDKNLSHQLHIMKGLNLSVIPFSRLVFIIKNRKKITEVTGLLLKIVFAYLASLLHYSVLITLFISFCYELHISFFYSPIRIESLRSSATIVIVILVRAFIIALPITLIEPINEEIKKLKELNCQ